MQGLNKCWCSALNEDIFLACRLSQLLQADHYSSNWSVISRASLQKSHQHQITYSNWWAVLDQAEAWATPGHCLSFMLRKFSHQDSHIYLHPSQFLKRQQVHQSVILASIFTFAAGDFTAADKCHSTDQWLCTGERWSSDLQLYSDISFWLRVFWNSKLRMQSKHQVRSASLVKHSGLVSNLNTAFFCLSGSVLDLRHCIFSCQVPDTSAAVANSPGYANLVATLQGPAAEIVQVANILTAPTPAPASVRSFSLTDDSSWDLHTVLALSVDALLHVRLISTLVSCEVFFTS